VIPQELEAVTKPTSRNSSAQATIIIKLTHPRLTSPITIASPQTSQEAT